MNSKGYYDIHSNVMYAAGGLKSDYAGHDKRFHGNLNIGANSLCGQYCYYSEGHEDWSQWQCKRVWHILQSGCILDCVHIDAQRRRL